MHCCCVKTACTKHLQNCRKSTALCSAFLARNFPVPLTVSSQPSEVESETSQTLAGATAELIASTWSVFMGIQNNYSATLAMTSFCFQTLVQSCTMLSERTKSKPFSNPPSLSQSLFIHKEQLSKRTSTPASAEQKQGTSLSLPQRV